MTLLYYDDTFLRHETGSHPENAGRLRAIWSRLTQSGLVDRCVRPDWTPATDQALLRVHTAAHLQTMTQLADRGGGQPEADTIVSPHSLTAARLAAGAATDAVHRVVAGEDTQAFCLVRPPGHHAQPHSPMGFCLLGNVAVAAREAVDALGLDRVLIVDWDVHHGNGTQDVFYRDGRVGFFSIHRWPFYPGTGAADEIGAADGLGTTRNLPCEFGTSRDRYLSWFARELEDFADKIKPQLVIVSAGFDAHRLDPVGSLGLESEDYQSLTQIVQDIAAAHTHGRLVSVLEGGYHPQSLAESVEGHLRELVER